MTDVPAASASQPATEKRAGASDSVAGSAGAVIVNLAWAGTAIFTVLSVAGAIAPSPFRGPAVVVAGVLFAIGVAAFLWAYATAVSRSRYDEIGIGGVYFLAGTAPRQVQIRLGVPLAVQVAVAIGTAAFRPFTSQAFVILAPMFGLGIMGLWGARHGEFPPRRPT